jgi:hypothetical protein
MTVESKYQFVLDLNQPKEKSLHDAFSEGNFNSYKHRNEFIRRMVFQGFLLNNLVKTDWIKPILNDGQDKGSSSILLRMNFSKSTGSIELRLVESLKNIREWKDRSQYLVNLSLLGYSMEISGANPDKFLSIFPSLKTNNVATVLVAEEQTNKPKRKLAKNLLGKLLQ